VAKRYSGPVVWTNELNPPGYVKAGKDGSVDKKARLVWIDDAPGEDDPAGHYEEATVLEEKDAPARVVALEAKTKGSGKAKS
jgi:hypothetical protein